MMMMVVVTACGIHYVDEGALSMCVDEDAM
jgi:hypothetical protein